MLTIIPARGPKQCGGSRGRTYYTVDDDDDDDDVRACAVEMHPDISQEPFCVEIYMGNAGRPRYHLD